MLRFLILLALVGSSMAQGSLDDLIKEVFTIPSTEAPTQIDLSPTNNLPPNSDTRVEPATSGVAPEGIETCKTDDGMMGECVAYYLCNGNNTIIQDGLGIIDIRRGEGPCENYMDVCCRSPEVVLKPIAPVTPAPEARMGGCGVRNPQGVGFRIKGDKDNEAQFGEFPWMVAILKSVSVANSQQKLNVYQCGGSLIHPSVVLTAAHCVPAQGDNAPTLKVRVGEWDTQTKGEIFPHQDRNVESFVIHEQFYAGGLFNDVALLFLDEPVEPAENVGVVCLPPKGPAAPPAECVASGWGKDVFGKEGRYQVILKKVELPIVPNPRCQSALRKTRLGQRFELHRSFICAGGVAGKDTCKGDGGSPLVCPIANNPDRYMQSGIVAWGIGCGENSTPGVYVNIAYLRKWIDDQLYLKNIDMSEYE